MLHEILAQAASTPAAPLGIPWETIILGPYALTVWLAYQCWRLQNKIDSLEEKNDKLHEEARETGRAALRAIEVIGQKAGS